MESVIAQTELVEFLLMLQHLSPTQIVALCQFVQNYVLPDASWLTHLTPIVQNIGSERLNKLVALVSKQLSPEDQQICRTELESVAQQYSLSSRDVEHGFGVLVQLFQLYRMMENLSIIQLMKLFEVVPTAAQTPGQQLQLLQQIQQLFQMLKPETIQNIYKQTRAAPQGQEQQILMQLLNLPSEYFQLYQPIRMLFQLDSEELMKLHDAIPQLLPIQMLQLLQMLQLQPFDVIELRSMLDLDEGMANDLLMDEVEPSISNLPMDPNMMNQNSDKPIRLQIVEQPPERSVYKRNLKPNPVVMLVGDQKMNDGNLYVVPTLIRCDTFQEEPKFITGNKPVRVTSGRVVSFRKLKVTTTSHQQGETMFCLRFELRRYADEDQFEVVDVVHSNPICVLSHSTQLKPAPAVAPTIADVIPEGGPSTGGTRVAILGANFIDSPGARIKFDNLEVMPQFHGTGTLVCHTPQHPPGTVTVRVSNANKKWSDSSAIFTFYEEPTQDRFVYSTIVARSSNNNGGLPESAFNNNFDSVRRISETGANINESDQRSYTALHYASASDNLQIAGYLLDQGADANYQDKYGSTAMHWASFEGNEQTVQLLVEHGANMNIPNYEGETPLTLSITEQHESIATFLVDNGAIINSSALDGHSPLHIAAAVGNERLVEMLLNRGAFVDVADHTNETPLHWAVREEKFGVVQRLVRKGASLNIQNEDGETPLHLAIIFNNQLIAQELLMHGASVKLQDISGSTCLHQAVENNNIEIIKMLMQRGAHIAQADAFGQTPMELASKRKLVPVLTLFQNNNATITGYHPMEKNKQTIEAFGNKRTTTGAAKIESYINLSLPSVSF